MQPLFQRFDFSYLNGEHFWDRSGGLSFALREEMPDLRVKESGADQRGLVDDEMQRELFFGIAAASIQSSAYGETAFAATAAKFLSLLASTFELTWLKGFGFRYIVSRGFKTREEGDAQFWPLLEKEAQAKWKAWPDTRISALQSEFRRGPFDVTVRFTILDLSSSPPAPDALPWHLTTLIEVHGTSPILVAEFDAEAFMNQISAEYLKEILSRLAPHLHEQSTA